MLAILTIAKSQDKSILLILYKCSVFFLFNLIIRVVVNYLII